MRGFRDAYGSWKIICICRRILRRSSPFTLSSFTPSGTTSRRPSVQAAAFNAAKGDEAASAIVPIVVASGFSPSEDRVSEAGRPATSPSSGRSVPLTKTRRQAPANRGRTVGAGTFASTDGAGR